MSLRVASNIGNNPGRQLGYGFNAGASAVGTNAPNTLGGKEVGMGIMGGSNMLSFMHDSGAQRTLTFYAWSETRKKWNRLGPVAAVYTMTCDPDAIGSVTAAEGMIIFVQADVNITNFWVNGAARYQGNPLLDLNAGPG